MVTPPHVMCSYQSAFLLENSNNVIVTNGYHGYTVVEVCS